MSYRTYEADEKCLNVLFTKHKPSGQRNVRPDFKIKVIRQYREVIADVARETLNHVAEIRDEFKKANDVRKRHLEDIAMVVKAHQKENVIIDKFLGDVERFVSRFKAELDKMQELFGNIIKKLPNTKLKTLVELERAGQSLPYRTKVN